MAPKDKAARSSEEAADPSFEVTPDTLQQLMASGNTELVGVLQKALGKMVGTSSGYIESLPLAVRNRIDHLREIDENRADIEAEFEERMKALEEEYSARYAPLDKELRDVVSGVTEVPANATGIVTEEGEEEVKGIPDFWMIALRNEPHLETLITDRDMEVLSYLTSIEEKPVEVEEDEEEEDESFTLVFHFATNPFFTNTTISKTYFMGDSDELEIQNIEADTIDWKSPSKNVTVKVMKKKLRPGQKGAAPIKLAPTDSFFNWFTPPEVPDMGNELEEEEMEQLQDAMEADFAVAEIIRRKIVDHPLQWYTGEALLEDDSEEESYEEGDEDEDDSEEEDESDSEEDDDDESDDEEPARPAAKVGAKPGAVDAQAQPQECKQQ